MECGHQRRPYNDCGALHAFACSLTALSTSFEDLSYGSTAIINMCILSVWTSSLYVRICHLQRHILTYMYKDGPRAERFKNNTACISLTDRLL